jgi:Phospholipase_D-nuclease N-terminal
MMKALIGLVLLPLKLILALIAMSLGVAGLLIGGLVALIPGGIGLIVAALTVFWLWMLLDAIRNDRLGGWERVAWVAVVWFLPFFGGLAYFLLGRSDTRRERVVAA